LELHRLGLRSDFTLRLAGRLVGTAAYHSMQREHRAGAIGYWLEQSSTRHGYMTAGVRRLLQHGFEELDLNRIELRVPVGNEASQRICARLGFQVEGVLREAAWQNDHFIDLRVSSLLRAEWELVRGVR